MQHHVLDTSLKLNMPLFTASRWQVATYLLGVCPFSIAFLVFLNSSVSFVVTDLIGQTDGVGSVVGTLGFADELVALIACPFWGLLSDRIGVRLVCFAGYVIIALALVVFVSARNVYPQLLLARLFFSIGGAAASTMVTAILPSMSFNLVSLEESTYAHHAQSSSHISDHTITPASYRAENAGDKSSKPTDNSSKIAGLVGMATGCGALIALSIFLPLPARFQRDGALPGPALQYSYYIVAGFALVLAIVCLFGLRSMASEAGRSWKGLLNLSTTGDNPGHSSLAALKPYGSDLKRAFMAGFSQRDIFIGYVGGFVARASSVAISLFVPLLINAAFITSGICDNNTGEHPGLPDLKRKCPRAYILAAELTGASQLIALLCAPLIGFWSARVQNKTVPLGVSAVLAIVGYPLFVSRFNPDDSDHSSRIIAFVAVAMIGIGQIGAIVSSLAILSHGVLLDKTNSKLSRETLRRASDNEGEDDTLLNHSTDRGRKNVQLVDLKGSVAGVYSFYGGAGILLLTKAGGHLFDTSTRAAPFYMMSAFNGILVLAIIIVSCLRTMKPGQVTR